MNRAEQRASDKAVRCIDHGTKVPGGVLRKVAPPRLQRMADRAGARIDARGFVKPLIA